MDDVQVRLKTNSKRFARPHQPLGARRPRIEQKQQEVRPNEAIDLDIAARVQFPRDSVTVFLSTG